jgi:hypothetical protein
VHWEIVDMALFDRLRRENWRDLSVSTHVSGFQNEVFLCETGYESDHESGTELQLEI